MQAAIAILFADVMQRLLLSGAVDFAVRMELPVQPNAMPTPQILPLCRKDVVRLLMWPMRRPAAHLFFSAVGLGYSQPSG